MTTVPHRGVPDILVDLLKEFSTLLRGEVRLARAEVTAKLTSLGVAMSLVIAGAVMAMAALIILLESAVAALIEMQGMTPTMASGVVGGVVFVLAAIIVWLGARRLSVGNLAPTKTVEQLQRDAALARDQVSFK